MAIISCRPHVPESAQQSDFQNATLQGNGTVAFSIATHIELLADVVTEGDVQNFLIKLLGPITTDTRIHFEFEVGPAGV